MIKAFFDSPSNRAGLTAWLATLITAGIQYAVTRHAPPMADTLGLVIGLLAIIRPDNSVTVAQLEKVIADLSTAIVTKSPASLSAVITDAEGIVQSVTVPLNSTNPSATVSHP
jgi:hypothetical protein